MSNNDVSGNKGFDGQTAAATEKTNSSLEINHIIDNFIGVYKDSTNRIGQKHLEEILTHIQSRAPIKKSTLVSQLRIKLLIGERYVMEYLDGLVAYEVIKIEAGMVYWCFDGNKKD